MITLVDEIDSTFRLRYPSSVVGIENTNTLYVIVFEGVHAFGR